VPISIKGGIYEERKKGELFLPENEKKGKRWSNPFLVARKNTRRKGGGDIFPADANVKLAWGGKVSREETISAIFLLHWEKKESRA